MKKIFLLWLIIFFTLSSNLLFPCTVFYAAKDGVILAGNNEDYLNTEAYLQFLPSMEGKNGRVFFGFYEFGKFQPFGGVNDQGLFYDVAALNNIGLDVVPEGELYKEDLIQRIMEECSTIEEVISLIKRYSNFLYFTNIQVMFGDRFGNSVIIERGKILIREGAYQVMTNFRQATDDFKNGIIPCGRYEIANNLLKESSEISKDLCRNILESVHQEGWYATVYSNIYDLKNGIIYLYYFHNFFEEIKLDISEELLKGERTVKINSLFKNNFAAKAYIDWKNWELENRKNTRLAKNFDPKIIDDFAGKYRVTFYPTKDSLLVVNENGEMIIIFTEALKIEVLPESNEKFFLTTLNGDYEFTFSKKEGDNKIYLKIKPTEFGNETVWEKIY